MTNDLGGVILTNKVSWMRLEKGTIMIGTNKESDDYYRAKDVEETNGHLVTPDKVSQEMCLLMDCIHDQLKDLYEIELSAEMVSKIKTRSWHRSKNGSPVHSTLNPVYPFAVIDCIHYKVREDRRMCCSSVWTDCQNLRKPYRQCFQKQEYSGVSYIS